jgi:hypothetical protein
MSFGVGAAGYAILILAIVFIARLMHLEQSWIIGTTLLLVGLGIGGGVQNIREKDPN